MTKAAAWLERIRLPFGFLAGPIAWTIQLTVGYWLTPVACSTGTRLPIYLLGIVAGLVTLAAGGLAYSTWRSIDQRQSQRRTANGRASTAGGPDIGTADDAINRNEFVVVAEVVVSAIFFWMIVLTTFYAFFLNPCAPITQPLP